MGEAASTRLIGSLIADRFRVERKLAAGGMGVVYLAEQVPLGRQVALKILDTQQLDDERAKNFGERFFLEAAAVAKLQHPNTITVHDFGKTDENIFYYAMEFVDGASMSQYVHKRGALPPAAAIHVGVQVCGSLREAHRAGLIHRDLKPGNIMLTERHDDPFFAKVLDFGLVKVMGDEEVEASDLTQSGMLLGSPRYMAPEQVLRFELDQRCDVYSLGGVLYHALTGKPPFRHGSQFELLRAQVDEKPAPFVEVSPLCESTPRLEALIMRMLEKERRDRPQDMTEVANELIACGRELGFEEGSLSGAIRASQPGLRVPADADSVSEAIEEPTAATSQIRGAGLSNSHSGTSHSGTSAVPTGVVPTGAVPAPAPLAEAAVPPSEGASQLIWLLAGVLAVLAAGGGVFAVVFFGAAEPVEPPRAGPVVEAPPEIPDPAPEPVATAVATSTTVRIETEPPGARIRHGEEDLGDAPFSFELPARARWELEVSLDGHETRTVLASPGRDVLRVRLSASVPEAEPPPEHVRHTRRRHSSPATPPVQEPTPPPTQPQFEDRGDLRHPWGHPR